MSNEARFATQLEHLPAEVWLKIFAFIPLPQLVPSFLGLNAHIDAIVRSVRRQRHVVRCNDADAVHFLRLFPATISHLMIVNSDMADLTPCTNLRSLTLKWGTIAQLDSIRPCHLPLLEVLHIKGKAPSQSERVHSFFRLASVAPRLDRQHQRHPKSLHSNPVQWLSPTSNVHGAGRRRGDLQ